MLIGFELNTIFIQPLMMIIDTTHNIWEIWKIEKVGVE
jgi:hypothetical protein